MNFNEIYKFETDESSSFYEWQGQVIYNWFDRAICAVFEKGIFETGTVQLSQYLSCYNYKDELIEYYKSFKVGPDSFNNTLNYVIWTGTWELEKSDDVILTENVKIIL